MSEYRLTMTTEDKQTICKRFCLGESTGALSTIYGLHRQTIEAILREGFIGLARVNSYLRFARCPTEPVVTADEDHV